MNKYITIFFLVFCILITIYILYKSCNYTKNDKKININPSIVLPVINEPTKIPIESSTDISIIDYELTIYTSPTDLTSKPIPIFPPYKIFEKGPWDPLNLANLISSTIDHAWNNCWTKTNIETSNNGDILYNIKSAGMRASDFIYIELIGPLTCGFHPPVNGKFIKKTSIDPGCIPIVQDKNFYMMYSNMSQTENITLYVLDEFSGELQRFLLTIYPYALIVIPDDKLRSNYVFSNPKYIENGESKSLENILNNQGSLIIGPKLQKRYTIDMFKNDIVLYNKNNNSVIYSGNSYNNTGEVCKSPVKLSTIGITSDYIPCDNSIIYSFGNTVNLLIYLTGVLKWSFKPRDNNGFFPVLSSSVYPNNTSVNIINDRLFEFLFDYRSLIDNTIQSKTTIEFDLYLYDTVSNDDFSLRIKVEIYYQESVDFGPSNFSPKDVILTVTSGSNITDKTLNIFTLNNKSNYYLASESMRLYIGPKLYLPFDIYSPSNMIEFYSVSDINSAALLKKFSIYEGVNNSEFKAIILCPPKPKDIISIFSEYKSPVRPGVKNTIEAISMFQYVFDYKCIIICLLGPLSVGLSNPDMNGIFDENRYKLPTHKNLTVISISENILIIRSVTDEFLNINIPFNLYVYDNVFKVIQIYSITRNSYYSQIGGPQILNVEPVKMFLIEPEFFLPNVYQNDIKVSENQGIKQLSYIYIGPLIFDNVNTTIDSSQDSNPSKCIPNCLITTFDKDDGCGNKCDNITLFNSTSNADWTLKVTDSTDNNNNYTLHSEINRVDPFLGNYPTKVTLNDTQGNKIFDVIPSIEDSTNKNIYGNITLVFNDMLKMNDSSVIKYKNLSNTSYAFDKESNKYIDIWGNKIKLFPSFLEDQQQCLINYNSDTAEVIYQDTVNIPNEHIIHINNRYAKNSSSNIINIQKLKEIDPNTFIRNYTITDSYIDSILTYDITSDEINEKKYSNYKKIEYFINEPNNKFKTFPIIDGQFVFPRNFSLKDEYPDQIEIPRDQQKCGCCYAFAIASCLGDRFALKYNIKSPYPSVLWMLGNCKLEQTNFYGEQVPLCGFCSGGKSVLLAKWLENGGYTKLESCFPYVKLNTFEVNTEESISSNIKVFMNKGNPFQEIFSENECFHTDSDYNIEFISNILERDMLISKAKFSIFKNTFENIYVTRKQPGYYTINEIALLIAKMKYRLCRGPLISNIHVTQEFKDFYKNEWKLNNKIVFMNTEQTFDSIFGFMGPLFAMENINRCLGVHRITITGWGVGFDKNGIEVEYWECRNSWGANNSGYFRVAISTFATQLNTVGLDIPQLLNYPSWNSYSDIRQKKWLMYLTPFYFDPAPIENLDELIKAGIFEKSNNYL